MTKQRDRGTAPGQAKQSSEPSFNGFLTNLCGHMKQPPKRIHLDLPTVPLSGREFELMANEIPLICRLINFHAVRILAAFASKPDTTTEQQKLLSAVLEAKMALNRLQISAENLSRRRHPKALWLVKFDDLPEEEDPFEYLPVLLKIRKRSTDGQGAGYDATI